MKIFNEDAPVNSAGSGEISGIGVGSKGEPGVHPRHQPKRNRSIDTKSIIMAMMRRAPAKNLAETCRANDFAGSAVFEISPSLFYELRMSKRKGKHWRTYLQEDDCFREIREYAACNPKGKIMVQNESTGEIMVVRYT